MCSCFLSDLIFLCPGSILLSWFLVVIQGFFLSVIQCFWSGLFIVSGYFPGFWFLVYILTPHFHIFNFHIPFILHAVLLIFSFLSLPFILFVDVGVDGDVEHGPILLPGLAG